VPNPLKNLRAKAANLENANPPAKKLVPKSKRNNSERK
jgi:hypothetical protein